MSLRAIEPEGSPRQAAGRGQSYLCRDAAAFPDLQIKRRGTPQHEDVHPSIRPQGLSLTAMSLLVNEMYPGLPCGAEANWTHTGAELPVKPRHVRAGSRFSSHADS